MKDGTADLVSPKNRAFSQVEGISNGLKGGLSRFKSDGTQHQSYRFHGPKNWLDKTYTQTELDKLMQPEMFSKVPNPYQDPNVSKLKPFYPPHGYVDKNE